MKKMMITGLFIFSLFGVVFSPLPIGAEETSDVFSKSVADIALSDASKAADALMQSLSSDQVFSSLGLSTPKFLKGNSFSIGSQMRVFGKRLSFDGKMKVNPTAKKGELLARLSGKLSSGKLSVGKFDAKSPTLEAVILNDGGSNKVYARILSTYRINNKKADAEIDIAPANRGVVFTEELAAKGLNLADFVPELGAIPGLNKFAFDKVVHTSSLTTILGQFNGKDATITDIMTTPKRYEMTGLGLSLSDFIPELSGVPGLKKFSFSKFVLAGSQSTVEGSVGGKPAAVSEDKTTKSYQISGIGFSLTDFVPELASIPAMKKFSFGKFSMIGSQSTIEGSVGGKPATVSEDKSTHSYQVSGIGFLLTDFAPELASIPALNKFSFGKFSMIGSQSTIEGSVGGKPATVSEDKSTHSYQISGIGFTLADFAARAASIPALKAFAFNKYIYTAAQSTVVGKINGKEVSVVDTMATPKRYEITGKDLNLSEIIPGTSSLTFLNDFEFDKLIDSSTQLSIEGKINQKKAAIVADKTKKGSFSIAADDLKLADMIPEADGLTAFDKFALDLVSVTPEQFEVKGKVSGKSVMFVKSRGAKKDVDVTADGLVLGDLFNSLKSIPVLNAVALEKLSLDGVSIEAEVLLNGDRIDVVSHARKGSGNNYVALFFNELEASSFIPAAKGHAMNSVSFDKVLFFILPGNASATSVTAASLPGSLPGLVGWPSSESMTLAAGVNFAAFLNVKKSPDLAGILGKIGVNAASLPMRGTLSPTTFKSMGGKQKGSANSLSSADQGSVLSGLSISSDIPLPKLSAIASLVKISGPAKLSVSGSSVGAGGVWGKLPASMVSMKPSGGLDMSALFNLSINDVGIKDNLEAVIDIGTGPSKDLSVIALSKSKWDKPFDVPGFSLNSGGFRFVLEKSKGSSSEDIAFFGTADMGKKKGVTVIADLAEVNSKLSLNYFELDGKFGLEDLPGGKNIPNAKKFELDEIKLSEHGVEAKTIFNGKKVDAYLFDLNGWNFAIDQKDFTMTEFFPEAKNIKPLAGIALPRVAILLSEKGLIATSGTMPVIAKDMFDDIFGGAKVPVNIRPGVGLIAAFDPAQMGILGEGLTKIGVHEDAIIMGEITGIFGGGSPGLSLALMMEKMGDQKGLPRKVMSPSGPKAVPPAFFIFWQGDQVDAGVKLDMDVQAGKDTLELATSIELAFSDDGIGIKLLGEMDGVWKSPFGIPGFSLANVKMDVEIDDLGEVKFGLAGDDMFEKLDVDLAALMSIALEDALPDGVAFSGSVNDLSVDALLEIAEVITDQPGKLSKIPVPFFAIHNALLAFATPGASDPQLGIVSEGFAFGGSFFFMGRELGSILGSGSPKPISGITFKGDIADIDLDVIVFKKNNIDIAINLQPKWIMNSQIDLLGATSDVMVDLQPPHFEFDVTEDMGPFGFADLRVRMDGFDLTTGKFDPNADISVVGELKSDLAPRLEKEIKQGLDDLTKSANAKLDADMKALQAAKADVDQLNKKIQAARAKDQRTKDRAELKLDKAKKRVASLKGDYDHDEHEKKHCGSRWTHWACKGYWELKGAATYGVYKVAEDVLTATEKAVAAAFDLDPRVAALIAERDIALASLSVAQGVVDESEAATDFVTKELENILETALKDFPFEVDQAIIIGDLRGMIANDDPMVLDMKFKMFGKPMREYFAIKLKDPAFDAVAFALLPALAMDAMTEAALKKADPTVARWVHAHIATKLAEAEAKVRKKVQAEEARFKDVLTSFEKGNAKFRQAFQDQSDAHAKIVSSFSVTDLMGDSKHYPSTYLAVGHSSLCLGVSKDGVNVIQEDCKDIDADRWSTSALDGDNQGYVELRSKGLCLKARKKGPTQSDGEILILSACDKTDRHEQWKVISSDDVFDKIANRYSQKCLHFDSENANPNSAFAIWTSCTGADSQDFRDIADAERPTLHSVNAMLKAENGSCLSIQSQMLSYFDPSTMPKVVATSMPVATAIKGLAVITKLKHQQMVQNKHEELVAEACNSDEDRFNYIEAVDGNIKLVHRNTGWCVYPKKGSQTGLALTPCDRGKDMTWRLLENGGGFQFQNLHGPKNCMNLPALKKNAKVGGVATLAGCAQTSGQLFDLVQ